MGVGATGNGADYSYLGYRPAARLCPAWGGAQAAWCLIPWDPCNTSLALAVTYYPAHLQPHTLSHGKVSVCTQCLTLPGSLLNSRPIIVPLQR